MSALGTSGHAQRKTDVRFTLNSDRDSGLPKRAMFALPGHVRCNGACLLRDIADIPSYSINSSATESGPSEAPAGGHRQYRDGRRSQDDYLRAWPVSRQVNSSGAPSDDPVFDRTDCRLKSRCSLMGHDFTPAVNHKAIVPDDPAWPMIRLLIDTTA
jgi:hypothetical protein